MARPLREEIAGGTFHIMNRGNRKAPIFEDNRDRQEFRHIVTEEKNTHGVEICADCPMGNHFHMVVVTPHGNLADFVGAVESRFASYFNFRHGYVGHLFQGRYKPVVVEDDIQLLTALCYVFLNPVSAGYVKKIEDYRWSSYRPTIGLCPPPIYLSIDWLDMFFPGVPLREAQRRFAALFKQARPVYAYFQQQEADVDAAAVKRVVRSYVGEKLRLARLPHPYRSVLRDSLSELLPFDLHGVDLATAIYEARVVHGYRVVEIAHHLRMHRATVSKIFRTACKLRPAR